MIILGACIAVLAAGIVMRKLSDKIECRAKWYFSELFFVPYQRTTVFCLVRFCFGR